MVLNCCWRKTLESPLNCKVIQPVNAKGKQSWIFIGRTDVEAETPVLWPPDGKNWLTGEELTHWKRPWCWEGLKVIGEGDDRGWVGWMASPTQSMDMGLGGLRELVMDREAWHAAVHGVAKSRTQVSYWTELDYHVTTNSPFRSELSWPPVFFYFVIKNLFSYYFIFNCY